MITLNKYSENFQDGYELIKELRRPIFSANQMASQIEDYSELHNKNLLWDKTQNQDIQNSYPIVSSLWAKMAEQLYVLGVKTETIKIFRAILSAEIDQKLYQRTILAKRQVFLDQFTEAELDAFYNAVEKYDGNIIDCTFFELLLINAICYKDEVSILFFLNEPYTCLPVSREILTAFAGNSDDFEYQQNLKKPHFCISINDMLDRFLESGNSAISKDQIYRAVLTQKEHDAVQIIRENYKDLKSVLIKTRDDQFQKIEVTKTKRLSAQKFFSQSFKKADYKSVRVEVVDGKTSYIEEIKKYKL